MDDSTEVLRKNPDVQEFYLGVREEGIRGTRRWKKKKVWR
jgi:branched-chain amino acid transport system ATP-binding protein